MDELTPEEEQALLRRAVYLTGATAVGKSSVALLVAERLGAEIVALDSMTLYRGMDIGTAKPSASDRARVRHHLLDVLDPWEAATVALYRRLAIATVADVVGRGKVALFVGGTPLYLKALLRGLFRGPESVPGARERLESRAESEGDAALHAALAAVDPATAVRLHPNDRRRVIRALEVHEVTGRPLSAWQTEHGAPAAGFRVLALRRERADLHARIDARIDRMFAEGFVDEVRRLRSLDPPMHLNPGRAVGYAEVADWLRGVTDEAGCRALIGVRTRRFAKQQATWFRGLAEVDMLDVGRLESPETTAARVVRWSAGR
jgi:tRNA dimethylallyltransferase